MRTRDSCADVEGFELDGFERCDLAGRLKNDELGSRSGARSAAERTILEMAVRSRMVMVVMRRHGQGTQHRRCRRTQFQQERSPAGRHETDGHIRPQQQHRQQNAGQYVVSPTVEGRWFHDASLRCQTVLPGASGKTTKFDRRRMPSRAARNLSDLHFPLLLPRDGKVQKAPQATFSNELGAASPVHSRERLDEILPSHQVLDVGGQFTPPVWILLVGARNVDRIDHPQKILDLQ